jgi:hypothetical protein
MILVTRSNLLSILNFQYSRYMHVDRSGKYEEKDTSYMQLPNDETAREWPQAASSYSTGIDRWPTISLAPVHRVKPCIMDFSDRH